MTEWEKRMQGIKKSDPELYKAMYDFSKSVDDEEYKATHPVKQGKNTSYKNYQSWLYDDDDDDDELPPQKTYFRNPKPRTPQILRLDPIPFSNGAKLFMTAAPDSLGEAITLARKAKEKGVTTVVVLLEQHEIDRVKGSKNILAVYREEGLKVVHYPIEDYQVPKDIPAFNRIIEAILTCLKNKSSVLVHCHGGHGRTGMIAVGCFVRLGKSVDEAYQYIKKIRSIIDTDEQFNFLDKYELWVDKIRREHDTNRGAGKGT